MDDCRYSRTPLLLKDVPMTTCASIKWKLPVKGYKFLNTAYSKIILAISERLWHICHKPLSGVSGLMMTLKLGRQRIQMRLRT